MIPDEIISVFWGMGWALGLILAALGVLVLWEVYDEIRLRRGVLLMDNLVRAAEQVGHKRLWSGTEKREFVLEAAKGTKAPLALQLAEALMEASVLKLKPSQRRSSKPPVDAYEIRIYNRKRKLRFDNSGETR